MKTITPFLLRFILVITLLTILFRFFLSYGITHESLVLIILSASLYGVLMFVSGWHFGKKDSEYLPLYDVGFRFHLATYIVHNGISMLWFAFGFNSPMEKVSVVYITAIVWVVILLVHLAFFIGTRRYAIKNLHRDNLFE